MKRDNADALMHQLTQQIKRDYPDWKLNNLSIAGAGIECLVCRGNTVKFGTVAIRIPWQRWLSDDNDPELDSRDILRQEALLAAHAAKYNIPVPTPFHLHIADDEGLDFLVSEFIPHDTEGIDEVAFGQLVKAIHQCPRPDTTLIAQGTTPLNETIAERLERRAKILEKIENMQLHVATVKQLDHLLSPVNGSPGSLLHMDARPANLLAKQGKIWAIVDWSNALLGDPAFELARIAECDNLSMRFLEGYGQAENAHEDFFSHLTPQVELLYRLDTAIMLAIVFLSEAPDPTLAAKQVSRVHTLDQALARA
ncbi:MAG: aminoglycoside phosphotransferase family protein [Chloroflexota bacterium]